jgi:two-component system, OmpR family, sensor histidine kinase KdpD
MKKPGLALIHRIRRFGGAILVVAAIVAACRFSPHVHLATPCVLLLLAVLLIAVRWGFWEAALATGVGDLLMAYFFMPTRSSWVIASSEYWIVFFAFLVAAIATAQVAAQARRLTVEATDRSRELERLYSWARTLSVDGQREKVLAKSLDSLVRVFALEAAAFYDPATGSIIRSGAEQALLSHDELRRAAVFDHPPRAGRAANSLFYPIHVEGQSAASLGICGSDLSEQTFRAIAERMESSLTKSLALEKAMKAETARRSQELKSAVLDSLIHEVKTPLSVIKTAATSLASTDWDAARGGELLSIINEEVDQLDASVNEVFWTAYIEAGTLEPLKDAHDIRQLVDVVLKELQSQLSSRPLKVEIPERSPSADFDLQMIKGVLKELLKNALKYSPPGSPLTISARQEGAEVTIGVTDRGIGVRPEERARIFEKHYRGDVKEPGTGLGLAIAKTIVEAHGGRIGITPQPVSGSMFYFSLPTSGKIAA